MHCACRGRGCHRKSDGSASMLSNLVISLYVLVGIVVVIASTARAQPCTGCFGGQQEPNAEGSSVVGLDCSFFISQTEGATAGTPGCESAQMALFQGCGCPEYDESVFCAMCPDDFFDIGSGARNRNVPLFPGDVKCGDILFPKRSSGRCEDVERAAFYCGCPNAPEPICSFCPEGVDPLFNDALLPPFYNQTCGDLHVLAPLYITNATCEALTDELPIQADYFCGCAPKEPLPNGCSVCGNSEIQYPNLTVVVGENAAANITCAQVGRLAESATDANYCADLVEASFNVCCLGIPSTFSPTVAPVAPTLSPSVVTIFPSEESSGHALFEQGRLVGLPLFLALLVQLST